MDSPLELIKSTLFMREKLAAILCSSLVSSTSVYFSLIHLKISHRLSTVECDAGEFQTSTNSHKSFYVLVRWHMDHCLSHCAGDQYWIFRDTVALPGYPRPLAEWGVQTVAGKGLSKVDAAFIWAHTGKTYLFGGREFWRFDELGKKVGMKPEGGYPKQASLWKGVPPDPDDIISWGDGKKRVHPYHATCVTMTSSS